MSEETSTPYVDWEYELITDLGETRLEFHGRTRGNELLLAHSVPPPDQDTSEWLQAFESGSIHAIPVSIDSYFAQQDDLPYDPYHLLSVDPNDPDAGLKDVEHIVFIGSGWATCDGTNVSVTLLLEVFRDAAVSFMSGFSSEYAKIEQRIFQLYSLIDPTNFSRFLSSLEMIDNPPPKEAYLIRRPPKATYPDPRLTKAQMFAVLRMPDGAISYEQLHKYLGSKPRTVRGWIERAELLKVRPQRLTGHVFTSGAILHQLAPWLKTHISTRRVNDFIADLLVEKLIQL